MSRETVGSTQEQELQGRIYEVILSDEQFDRLSRSDLDGVIEIQRLAVDDSFDGCVIGSLAWYFESEDSNTVIVPGSQIAWWLQRLDEAEQEVGVLRSPRQPYAAVYSSYPKKAFSIPIDRGEIFDTVLRHTDRSQGKVVVRDDEGETVFTVRRDSSLDSSDVRT